MAGGPNRLAPPSIGYSLQQCRPSPTGTPEGLVGLVSRQIHIDASAERVWAVLEDVRLLPELSESTVEVAAPERLTQVGQQFAQTVRLAGRSFTSTWTVLEIDPGSHLVIEGSVLPGTRYRMTESIEPDPTDARGTGSPGATGSGATLSLTMDYSLPFGPLGRLASKLGAEQRAPTEAEQVLAGVKRIVESRSHDATDEPSEHGTQTR
ncbi:hypothetical protein BH10ACT3_BH10ACT3_07540 [soil metagenome]